MKKICEKHKCLGCSQICEHPKHFAYFSSTQNHHFCAVKRRLTPRCLFFFVCALLFERERRRERERAFVRVFAFVFVALKSLIRERERERETDWKFDSEDIHQPPGFWVFFCFIKSILNN